MAKTGICGAVASFALVASLAGAAHAETTDWMSGYAAYKIYKKSESKGLVPSKIQCRDSLLRQLDVGETEYRVTFTDPPQRVDYLWAVGSDYGKQALKAKKEGYHQVSFNKYARKKSGLVVRCAIWHK